MRKSLLCCVSFVVLLAACDVKPQSPQTDAVEKTVVSLINKHRAAHGRGPVVVDFQLTVKARTWSHGMADGKCGVSGGVPKICHSKLSDGVDNWTWLGENVGMCYCTEAKVMHQNFVKSAGHNANMLDPKAKAVGIGVWHTSKGQWYITEVFKG